MSRIYWDTMLFVYLLEDHPQFAERVKQIHERIEERGDTICTSVFAVGEILAGTRGSVACQIEEAFRNPRYELQPFTLETAEHYGQIRASHRIAPADAIHLATAAQCKANLFLTNDRRLSKLVIPGIDFIAGLDVNLF